MYLKFFNINGFTVYFNIFVRPNWLRWNRRWNINRRRKVLAPVTEKLFIKWRIFESSKSKFEWNSKFVPKVDLFKWSGISFHSWNFWSYNLLIHEHWRLSIFEFMSTFLENLLQKSYTEFHVWFWESSCSK